MSNTTGIGGNSADACRARGWLPGTRLAGDEGRGVTVIEITALGERILLAKRVSHDGKPVEERENPWTLRNRDWKEVES